MPIRNQSQEKISKKKIQENKETLLCPLHPVFCFRYITQNSNYNFKYFKHDKRGNNEASIKLIEKLCEISRMSWDEFILLNKNIGCEKIPITQLRFSASGELADSMTKDGSFISIRFCKQNYRIIGIKEFNCPIFHIIGYDFDYSAYPHGT